MYELPSRQKLKFGGVCLKKPAKNEDNLLDFLLLSKSMEPNVTISLDTCFQVFLKDTCPMVSLKPWTCAMGTIAHVQLLKNYSSALVFLLLSFLQWLKNWTKSDDQICH